MSEQRIAIHDVDPAAYRAVGAMAAYNRKASIGSALSAIVDIRASQINHCAWCLDMHVAEAREAGVDQRKIDLVAAWREAPTLFDEREQAALALTEAVTLIADHGVPDEVWESVTRVYDESETIELIMAIAAINVWNRLNVTARTELGPEPYRAS